jgi:acyl carrier protein
MDSLTMAKVIMDVEEEFGVEVDMESLNPVDLAEKKVGQLIDELQGSVNTDSLCWKIRKIHFVLIFY